MGNGRNPFETGDKDKKPEAQTPPALNYTDIMKDKPTEKPAEKPVESRPAPTERPATPVDRTGGTADGAPKPLTQDQLRAEHTAGMAVERYMELSERGTKAITVEQFKIVKDTFELALKNAKELDPRHLQLEEAKAQDELAKVIPDAGKQSDAVAKVITTQSAVTDAIQALPDDKKQEFIRLRQTAETAARQLQARLAATNPQQFQVELQKLETKLIQDQSALSPELAKAIKEQTEFQQSKDGQAAIRFSQVMGEIEKFRTVPALIAFTYAQILDKFAEKSTDQKVAADARTRATELLKDAVKDPKIAAMVESSRQGLDLAVRLNVKTAGMIKAEEEAGKTFPELVPVQKAQDVLNDTKKDAKTRFTEAKGFYEEALKLTNRDARKVEDLRKTAGELEQKLQTAQKEIQLGSRKDFTADEKKDLQRLQVLNDQAKNPAIIRMEYAVMLNKYGHENNDEDAKKRAIEVLKDIEVVDKDLYLQSPEIQGALRQAQQNKKIEMSSAVSEAYTGSALSTLANSNNNTVVDFLLPGVQPGLTAALRPLGTTPSEIPYAGPVLFGDRKKSEDAVVRQLAAAYLSNPDATQEAVDKQVRAGQSGVREYASDGAAIAAGWLTKYGVQSALSKAPGWGKVAGIGLGLATAGLTKDYLADGELGTTTDWLRGGGMFGGSVLLMKGLSFNPSRQVLSEGTTAGISRRLGVEGLAGKTGTQLSESILAAEGGAAGSRFYRALQYINPSTYTGLTWTGRYVGFGGERTAAALADGTLSFAGYNARRSVGSAFNTFGMAYAFGAGREGLYIGTGQKMADGTPYSLESALAQMNSSGLQSGLTATLVVPVAGSTFRIIPGASKVLDGTASLATRLAPTAAPEIGRFGVVAAGAGLQQLDNYNNANRLKDLSAKAKTVADEAKAKAEEELRKRMQPPAPKK